MPNPSVNSAAVRKSPHAQTPATVDHYLRLILYRKWLVVGTFLLVSAATIVVAWRMPDIYTSETLILVDPQKVPETYVKSTVTGDVRDRLGALTQQILSATRLQKIIDSLNLYPAERKTMAREDVIAKMRDDISVSVVSDFSASQDLQAFRIRYSGRDPRLTAQVANEVATQFIDENLKAREALATGTTDFLENQLQEARKALEGQELKLRDFQLHHLGEMPEQESSDLQILGQLQSQMQLEGEALARAQQQRSVTEAMMTQVAPVVDVDDRTPATAPAAEAKSPAAAAAAPLSKLATLKAQLAAEQAHGYTDDWPDVRRLKGEIAKEEAQEKTTVAAAPAAPKIEPPPVPAAPVALQAAEKTAATPKRAPVSYSNPILVSQLKAADDEIAKHKAEQERLGKLIGQYQKKLESIPVNEQAIAALVRDHDISKAHYQQLLNNQLSAETATQLEIRQKGEKFSVLDPAQPAERPDRPKRYLIDSAGSAIGLALGILLALVSEFFGLSITSPDQIASITGAPVLEVIPVIETKLERRVRRKRFILATVSAALLTLIGSGAFFLYQARL